MGYQPDPANNPPNPPDYDVASETEAAPAESEAADPAKDGPGIYPWDTVDEQGTVMRRKVREPRQQADLGAASTYNTSPAPQDLR